MKVLLVKPRSWKSTKGIGPPLGLGYIASFLIQAGHDVKIADLMVSQEGEEEKDLRSAVRSFKPGLVGITSNSHERLDAFKCAAWARQESDAKIAIGGPHISALKAADMEDLLRKRPEIDILVPYEGEHPMRDICAAIESGKSLAGISGTATMDNGKFRAEPQREFIEDLDSLRGTSCK